MGISSKGDGLVRNTSSKGGYLVPRVQSDATWTREREREILFREEQTTEEQGNRKGRTTQQINCAARV